MATRRPALIFVVGKIHIAEATAPKAQNDAIFLVKFFADEIRVLWKAAATSRSHPGNI